MKHACETLRYSNETQTNCMSCQNLANRNEGLTKCETTSQTLKCIISLGETTASVQKCEKNTNVRFEDCSIQDILVLHQEPGAAEDYLLYTESLQ